MGSYAITIPRKVLFVDRSEVGLELPAKYVLGDALLALRLGLADAEDRLKLGLDRRDELPSERLVRLGEEGAALRVPEDHSLDADRGQHRGRDLAGVGA